jgi:hypothetical protein
MPHPFPFATSWAGGMRRDIDRAQMPPGTAWNILDWIPDDLGAPLTGRGGWAYAGAALSGATSLKSVTYAPFSAGGKVLAIDQAGTLWNGLTAASIGAAVVPGSNPAFHRGLAIIPNNDGSSNPKSYDGTTLQNLAGSPPTGMYAGVYKDHALLARSSAEPQRLWFSASGDPTSWDTTAGWWDATGKISGLAPAVERDPDLPRRQRGTVARHNAAAGHRHGAWSRSSTTGVWTRSRSRSGETASSSPRRAAST